MSGYTTGDYIVHWLIIFIRKKREKKIEKRGDQYLGGGRAIESAFYRCV